MIVVDSSAWIDYFNGSDSAASKSLQRAIDDDQWIGIVDLIVTEVLQGFRFDRDFRKAREILLSLPRLALTLDTHVRAAELYRRLRTKGVTIRSTIDCLIAQACIDADSPLITGDTGDFVNVAKYSRLRLL